MLLGMLFEYSPGVDWWLKWVIEVLDIERFWHHDAYISGVAGAIWRQNGNKILVDLFADDRHFWICQFLEAVHEFGEGHCHPDHISGDAV